MKSKFRYFRGSGPLVAFITFASIAAAQAQTDGTWASNVAGDWHTAGNWIGGNIASGAGATADFSTLNITEDHVIVLNAPVTIGTLRSQDLTTLSNSWVFTGDGPLTLDNGGSQPVFNILNRLPIISAPLAGSNGFSKTGGGALVLSGDNSGLSGVINLPNVGGTNGSGLILASETAIGGVKTVNVDGTPTSGPYLALSGGVTLDQSVTLNFTSQGGNSAPPGALRGEGGAAAINTINGPININGGGVRLANTAGGLLQLNGVITGGANSIIFRFAANQGIHVTNTGNAWTGNTIHSEGILRFDPGTLPASSPLVIGASGAGTVHLSGTFNRALGNGPGQVRLGGAETTVNGRALGLSARGGDLIVNFGGAGGELFFNNFAANATGTPDTINTNLFVLNGPQADSKLTLVNPLNINGAARTLQVNAATTEITGGINGGTFNLTKTGAGTLLLSSPNSWTGDLIIAGGDSTNNGFVRVTNSLALGPESAAKNVISNGSNRATAVLELEGGVSIAANKGFRMTGKSFIAAGGTAIGTQFSMRNVSGDNLWAGDCIIYTTGGAYGIESAAGTLTLGADPSTSSILRNEVANSHRPYSLFGGGNFVINSKISDNNEANTSLNKVGSGKLTIPRTDNDFDVAPNLFSGITEITSLANSGEVSSLGTAAGFNLGGTLLYSGGPTSSDRVVGVYPAGATLASSGAGPLELTSATLAHRTGAGSSVAYPFPADVSTLTLANVAGLVPGQSVTGTGIAAGTTITAVDPDARTLVLSIPTAAATTTGTTLTYGGAPNLDRTLTLAGTHAGDNLLAANLTNPGAGKLGLTKDGPGKWLLTGTAHTYTGPTELKQGSLAFDGGFPGASRVTSAPGTSLSLGNLVVSVDPVTGRALSLGGALNITGPVAVALAQAAPVGTFTIFDYASITGAANLTSNYRNVSFTGGAASASMTVGAGAALVWTGAVNDDWDVRTTSNWSGPGNTPQTFHWGDSVRFDDVGAIARNVYFEGELRPAAMTVDADTADYVFSGPGTLSGPFLLTKSGDSIATIDGIHDNFSGPILITEGILRPQTNRALGTLGKTITIQSGGALDTNGAMNANRDYHAVIAGNGTTLDAAGAITNSAGGHNNGFGSITLAGNASIGGSGRWDLRPLVAGQAKVDLAGFTLTKTGFNYIGLVDGEMTANGSVIIDDGTLGVTRMVVGGSGAFTVNEFGLLQFENYTSGSFDKHIALNQGRLRLQGSNLNISSSIAVTGYGSLDIENARTLTVAGPVTGAGDLEKTASAGMLTLTGTNTYTGLTRIYGGTLVIGSQSTAGTLGAGEVINDGLLVLNRGDAGYLVPNVISGTGAVTIGQNNGGSFESLVTLTGNNTFTGNVTVNSGGLKILSPNALGSGPKSVVLTNGTQGRPQLYLDGGTGGMTLPADISFITSSTQISQPAIGNLSGNNVIEGNLTLTSGGGSTAVSVLGGSLTLSGGISANVADRRLVLGGSEGPGTVSGLISNGTSPVGVDKVGSNTWTLTGANTYTGSTVVSGGTLIINGVQTGASGPVIVNSDATLGGTGTLGGSLTTNVGSALSPGAAAGSIGTLRTAGPAVLSGTLAMDVGPASADRLAVGGSLDLNGATLQVNVSGVAGQTVYVLATYGMLTGTFSSVSGVPAGYLLNYDLDGLKQIALVQTDGDSYGNWASLNGIGGAGSGVDSDGDGVRNGIEFVIGGNPNGGNSNALLPTVNVDGSYLNFVFRRTDDSITYNPFVEYGNSLTGWTAAANGVNGILINVVNDGFGVGIDRVTVRIPRALAAPGSQLFARLRVNIP